MRLFFKNTQLFPIDSAIITYHPEDESSPERADRMRPMLTEEMKRSHLYCMIGVFDNYSRYFLNPTMLNWRYIYPTGAEIKAPKPPVLPDPRKDPKDLPKNTEEAEKRIKLEMQKSNNPAEALSITTASNGIMIASKSQWASWAFEKFAESAGEDKKAAKGFVTVQFDGQPSLVFAHLQDDYSSEEEHSQVRFKQISQMVDSLELNGNSSVFIIAELMMRGDKGRKVPDGEWDQLFGSTGAAAPTRGFQDCWTRYMVPPGVNPGTIDQGYTAIDRTKNIEVRLSYVLMKDGDYSPYHISVPLTLRDGSDRYGISLEYGIKRPHCSPSDAIVVTFGPNSIETAVLKFDGENGPQWIYVKDAGTFSVVTAGTVFEWEVYALSDLSIPMGHEEEADLAESDQFAETNDRAGGHVRGKVYATNQPFLIKASLKSQCSGFSGNQVLVIVRHDGGTRGTAITIKPDRQTYKPSFPSGRRLPPNDTLWLRLPAPRVLSERRTQNRLFVSADPARVFKLQFDDGSSLHDTSAGDVEIDKELASGCVSYILANRPDTQHEAFSIRWESNVSYLRLDRPLFLHIDDETGADWAGDDEVTLWLSDEEGSDFFEVSFLDADTGDNFNITNRNLLDALAGRGHQPFAIAFVEKINVLVREDDFDDDTRYSFSIQPLTALEGHQAQRTLEIPMQSGKYSLKFTLSLGERIWD